jgi:hypothetical protein
VKEFFVAKLDDQELVVLESALSKVAAILALHGFIHTLGFSATWRIGKVGAVAASPRLLPGFTAGCQPMLAWRRSTSVWIQKVWRTSTQPCRFVFGIDGLNSRICTRSA